MQIVVCVCVAHWKKIKFAYAFFIAARMGVCERVCVCVRLQTTTAAERLRICHTHTHKDAGALECFASPLSAFFRGEINISTQIC